MNVTAPERMISAPVSTAYALWMECLERAYVNVAHTEEFCRLQSDLTNTLNAARLRSGLPQRAARAPEGSATGYSKKHAVWEKDKIKLYRYEPIARRAAVKPVLICYALVNRPYVLDLDQRRSLVRRLLRAGIDVHLIDWGYPDPADRQIGLHQYIERYLDGCVRRVLETRRVDSLNLLGVCQGGTFALCYTSLHPENVRSLVTAVTPVDFRTPENLLSKWAQGVDVQLMRRAGNIPGAMLNALLMSLRPFRTAHQTCEQLLRSAEDPRELSRFMCMQQWLSDNPDQTAAACSQFVKWFYHENRLALGALRLGSRRVNLQKVVQPLLNIYATRDHIVPPSASIALRQLVGTTDYTSYAVDAGHIGVCASRPRAHDVPARIIEWLRSRGV